MVLPVLLHCPKVSVRLVGARPSEVEDLGTDVAVAVIVVGIMFMVWVNRSPPKHLPPDTNPNTASSSIGWYWPLEAHTEIEALKSKAEQGDAIAQFDLGVALFNDLGGLQSRASDRRKLEAVLWLGRAAQQGHAAAQHGFGFRYQHGWGVPKDYTEAIKWYKKSAEQGYAAAQYSLATSYLGGLGVPEDEAEAAKWLGRAGEQGVAGAQYYLGLSYRDGWGLTQNLVRAYKWVNLAAQGVAGWKAGKYTETLNQLAEKMTPDQIAEAQRLAREWKPTTWEELEVRLQEPQQ